MDHDTDSLRRRAEILSALAHPSRLVIVDSLQRGEMTVSELTQLVGSDMSTVSRHLSVLRNAGILASRRDGNRILYRLLTPCVTGFFSCVEQVLQQRESSGAGNGGRSR
jgi:ArsR family transcriptional regulator